MVHRGVGFIASIALAVLASSAAPAQDRKDAGEDSEGYLIAFACGQLTTPLALQVDILDDSKPALRLRAAMIDALKKRNAVLSATASMRLSLESETVREGQKRKGRDLGELQAGTGADGDDDVKVRMNVWSNKRDSIIGGRKDQVESQAVDEVRVTVTIHSMTDGKCLWQGEAVHQLNGRDPAGTSERLVPYLADAMGKTVSKKPVQLE